MEVHGNYNDWFTCVDVDNEGNILIGGVFNTTSIKLNNGQLLQGHTVANNSDAMMIQIKEEVLEPAVPETSEVLYKNGKHKYNITTEVEGEGGTISGQGETPYEQVKYTEDSQKDIIITPKEGYEVRQITINGEEIDFIRNEDSSVNLDKFINMQEDKHIVVKFTANPAKVIVHHYILNSNKSIVPDEIIHGEVDIAYKTKPREDIEKYEVVVNKLPSNAEGIMTVEPIEVTYYYTRRSAKVIVHHYLDGTTESLAPDEEIEGRVGSEYETDSIEIEGYEVLKDKWPSNSIGSMQEQETEVIYYYTKKAPKIITNTIYKSGTELMETEDQQVEYNITYNSEIIDVKGNAKITIIDYLPFQIDEERSDINGGTYNEAEKTIIWEQQLENIDTYKEGSKTIKIEKHINIVFKNMDYSQKVFFNYASGKITIDETEKDTGKIPAKTETNFRKNVIVTKKWDNSNNIYIIPDAVKIQLKHKNEIVAERIITSINRIENTEIEETKETWSCEFTDLEKYDDQGKEIDYIVAESELNEGDLKYYEPIYDQENKIITNKYVGPIISQKKTVLTENGKEYVVEGEKITYRITVKNGGDVEKDVVIKDNVPTGTTFVDGSIKVNGVTNLNTVEDLANGIIVTVPGKGETTLSFDVIVNELEEGTYFKQIKNVATVDDEKTNETITNINKSNIVFGKKVTPEGNVQAGQELTYNIRVQNTGSLADIVKIIDSIPENTTYVANSVKLGDKTYTDEELLEEKISEGEVNSGEEQNVEKESVKITKIGETISKILVENLEVSPDEEIILSFKVTVNENVANGTKISNVAVVNDNPSNVTENTVVKPVINVTKEINDVIHTSGERNRLDYVFKGDTITYNIKATNNGDLGGYVTVKDIISDKVLLEAGSITINGSSSYKTSSGEIIDLKEKTADDLATGLEIYVPERQEGKAGETIISFNVKVKENAVTGDVLNKVTWIEKDKTEEHETKIVKVPVVIFEKASKVIRKTTETQELPDGKVTANDEIEYTITVTNTGTADSNSFTITDTIPENTNLIDEINFHDEYLTNGELQGNKLTWLIDELKAGQSVDVKFSVVVKYNKAETLEIKNTAYVNEIPTNEIVTEYKKPTPILTTGITKDGDGTAIVGNGISYTIAYTGEIKDFVGKANIVIVDELPYEIDEVKSKLDNGIYDSESKTITWEIPVENINTYTTKKSNEITITKELLLYYDTQLIEQNIENKVTARTEIIELSEEKVVDTDEVTASHIVKIRNLSELPLTGGMGTVVFIAVGVAFIVAGAVLLITINKKKNAKE